MKTMLKVCLFSSNEKAKKMIVILPSNAESTNIQVFAEKFIFFDKQKKHTVTYKYI